MRKIENDKEREREKADIGQKGTERKLVNFCPDVALLFPLRSFILS